MLSPHSTRQSALLCFLVVAFLSFEHHVHAFPSGAGGCSGQQGSVNGAHLSATTLDEGTSLADSGLSLSLTNDNDGASVDPVDGSTFEISPFTSYNIALSVTSGEPFKGFLFRLSGLADTTTAISVFDETYSQIAAVCTASGVGGVTHINSNDKDSVNALVALDTPGTYELQVTAVYEVESDLSSWVWETYLLNVVEAAEADPTPAPTTAEPVVITEAPTTAPSLVGDTVTLAPTTTAPLSPAMTTMAPTTAVPVSPADAGTSAPTTAPPQDAGTMSPSMAVTDMSSDVASDMSTGDDAGTGGTGEDGDESPPLSGGRATAITLFFGTGFYTMVASAIVYLYLL